MRDNQLFGSLCQAYLRRAKLAYDTLELDEANVWLKRCVTIAEAQQLTDFIVLAQKEERNIDKRRAQISTLLESDKPLSPLEQERLFQQYLQEALNTMKKD